MADCVGLLNRRSCRAVHRFESYIYHQHLCFRSSEEEHSLDKAGVDISKLSGSTTFIMPLWRNKNGRRIYSRGRQSAGSNPVRGTRFSGHTWFIMRVYESYMIHYAPMAEWSKATDCKPVKPQVQILLGAPSILAFVQWIGHDSSKVIMGVRFPHAGPVYSGLFLWYNNSKCECGEIGKLRRLKISRFGLTVRVRPLAPRFLHGSSIGLGHWPFTSVRRVRFPYRVPILIALGYQL